MLYDNGDLSSLPLREKCSYSELFWSALSHIWTEYEDLSPYSVRMRENADQNNPEYGRFLRSARLNVSLNF